MRTRRMIARFLCAVLLATLLVSCSGDEELPTSAEVKVDPESGAQVEVAGVTLAVQGGTPLDGATLKVESIDVPAEEVLKTTKVRFGTKQLSVSVDGGDQITEETDAPELKWPVPSDWDEDIVPVVIWEDGEGGWRWLPTSVEEGDSGRIATAPAPHFSSGFLGGFDVKGFADSWATTLANYFTGRSGVEQPGCTDEEAAKDRYKVESDDGDAVKWCAGVEDDQPVLRVANNRRTYAQLSVPTSTQIENEDNSWGFSIDQLSRALNQGMAELNVPEGKQVLILRPGETVTLKPGDRSATFTMTGSGIGFLIQVLESAFRAYLTVASGAGVMSQANTDPITALLGSGSGDRAAWISATSECLVSFVDTYGDDIYGTLTSAEDMGNLFKFAAECGLEVGKASITASGPLAWLVSSTAAAVYSTVSLAVTLLEQLIVSVRETVDAVTAPSYEISVTPIVQPTKVTLLNPIDSSGNLKDGYTLRIATDYPVGCGSDEGSSVSKSSGNYFCFPTSSNAYACWKSPTSSTQVWCLDSPWSREVVERETQTPLSDSPAPTDPSPMGVETSDGSRWVYRYGGAVGYTPPDTGIVYYCDSGPCEADEFAVLLDRVDLEWGFDTSKEQWETLAWSGDRADDPTTLGVVEAWYITTEQT